MKILEKIISLIFNIEIKFLALSADFQTCFRECTNSSGYLPYLSEVKDKNRSFSMIIKLILMIDRTVILVANQSSEVTLLCGFLGPLPDLNPEKHLVILEFSSEKLRVFYPIKLI